MAVMTVAKAQEALRKAKAKEFGTFLRKQEQTRAAEKRRIDEDNKKYKAEEDKLLSRMKGLIVSSVELFTEGEGTVYFKFTDGTEFFCSAHGDDCTSVVYGYEEAVPRA
jgi:hypothetical protein